MKLKSHYTSLFGSKLFAKQFLGICMLLYKQSLDFQATLSNEVLAQAMLVLLDSLLPFLGYTIDVHLAVHCFDECCHLSGETHNLY